MSRMNRIMWGAERDVVSVSKSVSAYCFSHAALPDYSFPNTNYDTLFRTNACTHEQLVQVHAGEKRMQMFALQDSLSQVASCGMYTLPLAGVSFAAQSYSSAASIVLAALLLAINSCGARTQIETELKLKTSLMTKGIRNFGEAQGRRRYFEMVAQKGDASGGDGGSDFDEDNRQTIVEPLMEVVDGAPIRLSSIN